MHSHARAMERGCQQGRILVGEGAHTDLYKGISTTILIGLPHRSAAVKDRDQCMLASR